jgi:uncharacterized membrane protein YfcA
VIIAAFVAGAQNALAGGGSFLTFPALLYAGLDPRAANITSSIALFPAQVTTGLSNHDLLSGAAGLSVRALILISLIGGALGALLLLATPVSIFTRLMPYLVLFATLVFVWGNFFRKSRGAGADPRINPLAAGIVQFLIALYGGYFGGGIGILMMATFTTAGMPLRHAAATKNMLASVMGGSSVLIFVIEVKFNWHIVLSFAVAAVLGGQMGVFLVRRINETALRIAITAVGAALTIALFSRA